ncbi:MAG TPA: toxin-antitoxin system HicB family antitoxin [Acidimicrobiia bacterium]|nr:toxin-antitoxin system HicB family antitoxin [Acidimicrobiia bacterium]
MDIDSVISQVNAMIYGQLRLAADDPAVEAAGEAILTALDPALRQAGMALAEQAAAEVGAQLPDRKVDVVLSEGQPSLIVRDSEQAVTVSTDELDARMTVRLPENLKEDIELAAQDLGDSVNTFVVRALSSTTRAGRHSSRATFKGTIET